MPAAAALSKVPNPEATHMGSNNGKSKESNHRSDINDKPDGLPINLGSDANLDIDCILVLEKGFSELSNMTQESLNTFSDRVSKSQKYLASQTFMASYPTSWAFCTSLKC